MECVVFAVGGSFVVDVVGVLHRLGWTVRAFVSNEDGCPNPNGLDPVVSDQLLPGGLVELPCVVGMGTPSHRRTAHDSARRAGFTRFPAVVDPSAVVTHDATVAEGAFVNAGVVVAARARLGPFSVINRSSSIGHGSGIGAFAFVGPGATVCGGVSLADDAFVGAGAILIPDSSVGVGAFVGAGSVILGDVPDHARAVGRRGRVD